MKLFPLINNFRATSYLKAFILNALIGGIITALAIELRLQLEDNSSKYYKFWMNVYNVKSLHIKHKLITTFISTSIVALLIYILFFYIFLYGGGQLSLIRGNISNWKMLTSDRSHLKMGVGKIK
jgi:hypothetical protein|uniref:Uncharacterized protein n=1 Tax=viral metagenome TaxID=1070528 RepID=A0A6C0CJV3_9ZZZZ